MSSLIVALIVAIDGPSGVGKSTTSRSLARALGVPHIDTGAMYRAVALGAIRSGVALDDADRLEKLASGAVIQFRREGDSVRVILDGEDISQEIRTPAVSMAASRVSAVPAVRRVLVLLQQEMGRRGGGVLEGRDIGTKVFPHTPYKFFLTARPEIRAERRRRELLAEGIDQPFESVLAETLQRDGQDSTRADSPLTWDSSYQLIDTSDMTIDQVVAQMVRAIRLSS